jgi:xanthine/CO dehydrogenase XdhC/CoxF family maturation factor
LATNVRAFTVYTATNDPEQLLGREHQYVSKVTFADRRVAPSGGSIEVFQTPADLAARVVHLQRSEQSMPHEYYYGVGTVLLRLSGNLPPEVAAVYGAALREVTTQQ